MGRVTELPFQDGEALLRVRQRQRGELGLFGVEVEIDVLPAQHVPLEIPVLYLVLAEVP